MEFYESRKNTVRGQQGDISKFEEVSARVEINY